MGGKLLESSLENASFNIAFQVLFRCVTFFLNAFVLRYVSQAVLGVMNVRLLLLESTILFLSREAFRRACLSQTSLRNWAQIINLLWLTVPLSVIVSAVFGFIWLHVIDVPSPDITPHYRIGVWSIAVSCIVEMFSEPLYLVAQAFLFIRLQLAMNSITVLIRMLIFVPWIVCYPDQAVLAFSAAQLVANTVYCLGYYAYFHTYIEENNKKEKSQVLKAMNKESSSVRDRLASYEVEKMLHELTTTSKSDEYLKTEGCGGELRKMESEEEDFLSDSPSGSRGENPGTEEETESRSRYRRQSSIVGFDSENFPFKSLADFLPDLRAEEEDRRLIHPDSARLTWSFLKQGVMKQVLTEGERYVMTLFSIMSFNQQGVYDVVNNLGSLAARFLFRPIEDSLYFYFSQSVKRDVDVKDQNQERMKEVANVLRQALKCIISLGSVVAVFGQNYSSLLLYLYGGEAFSSGLGPMLLKAHCFSVLLLGINGITECYTFSTMTADQLNRYNYLMAAFSVMFLFLSWALTRTLGGVGFIVANCLNMLARIAHSYFFIRKRYGSTDFQPFNGPLDLINPPFLVSLFAAFLMTKFSEDHCSKLVHFMTGGISFAIVVLVWSSQERELVNLALSKYWRKEKVQ